MIEKYDGKTNVCMIELSVPANGEINWEKGKEVINEGFDQYDPDDLVELVDTFSDVYSAPFLFDPDDEEEAADYHAALAEIAEKILLEDLLVLELDLAHKDRAIESEENCYLLSERPDENRYDSFSRADRLTQFSILGEWGVGFKTQRNLVLG